jgi:TRAP-type C4-dicarboxylate transport system permease small subunit
MSGYGVSVQASRGDTLGVNPVVRKITPESPIYVPLILNCLLILFAGIFYVYNYTEVLPVSEYIKIQGPPGFASS